MANVRDDAGHGKGRPRRACQSKFGASVPPAPSTRLELSVFSSGDCAAHPSPTLMIRHIGASASRATRDRERARRPRRLELQEDEHHTAGRQNTHDHDVLRVAPTELVPNQGACVVRPEQDARCESACFEPANTARNRGSEARAHEPSAAAYTLARVDACVVCTRAGEPGDGAQQGARRASGLGGPAHSAR